MFFLFKKSFFLYISEIFLKEYQLGLNPLSDIITTSDKDGHLSNIPNPHKKTEQELVKIIEAVIMDLKY